MNLCLELFFRCSPYLLFEHVCVKISCLMFLLAAPQLIYGTKIDYLVFDYLSEITMSLLIAAKHKQKVSICSNTAFSPFTAYKSTFY